MQNHQRQEPTSDQNSSVPDLADASLSRALPETGQQVANQDFEMAVVPAMAPRIGFNEFIALAKEKPELFLRNSAQYIADAMTAYGVGEEPTFGKNVPIFGCMSGPFRSESQLNKREPRGQTEGINEIYSFFKEQGRQGRPNKGLIISSVPGAGKNCVIDAIMDTVVDYANNHPEGARWRVALKFDNREDAERRVTLTPQVKSVATQDSLTGSYIISSSTNANPIALLSEDRPFLKKNSGELIRGLSERDKFAQSAGDTCNTEFVLSARLDPTIAQAYQALVDSYTDEFHGDRQKAIEVVREKHIVAERMRFDSEIGEGVLTRMPHSDPHSDATSLAGSLRFRRPDGPPKEIDHAAEKIWKFSGPLLDADLIHFEDMLMLVRAPQELLQYGHLNALIERGLLQVVCHEDPSHIFTVNKDLSVIGSVNDEHIHALKEATSFAALMSRFNVITWQLIRDYTEEAGAHRATLEVALGDEIKETPHALELASLFAVSTRLLDPQAGYYHDERVVRNKELGPLAERLVGVQKAIYLGSKSGKEARDKLNLLLPKEQRFSADEMKVLEVGEHKWQIAHEYKGDVMKKNVSLYDGGFGISTRDAQELVKDIVSRARETDTDFTVKTVVDELRNQLERGFHYFEAPSATLEEIKKQNFGQLCMKEGIGEAEIRADLDSSGRLTGKAKDLWEKAVKLAEASFPLRPPSALVEQIERYGRLLVQEDVRTATGLVEQSNLEQRLEKYIIHLAAYGTNGSRAVPKKYRSGSNMQDAAGGGEHDEGFMRELEEDAGVGKNTSDRDKFRKDLWKNVSSWIIKRTREQSGVPLKLEECITDIFQEQTFGDLLSVMKEKFDNDHQQKIEHFIEDVERYRQKPELLQRDKENVMRQERAERFDHAYTRLLEQGYTDKSLPQLVRWGFAIKR